MSWTYADILDSDKDKIRFLVGDTDGADQQISDEGIINMQTLVGGDVFTVAASICDGLAGKYARLRDVSIDSLRVNYGNQSQSYSKLAIRLRGQAGSSATIGTPTVTGVSLGEMAAVNSDNDRVPSSITSRQMDIPNTQSLGELDQ